MSNDRDQYVIRTDEDVIIPCGHGADGLRRAVDRIRNQRLGEPVALIERSLRPTGSSEWEGEIVATTSRYGILDPSEYGQLWATRAMTARERAALSHYNRKLVSIDLAQVTSFYACRHSDFYTQSAFVPGRLGLEEAMRQAQAGGFGCIVRNLPGIEGDTIIAAFTAVGYWFTKHVDECERRYVVATLEAMEAFGELRPVSTLDGTRMKNTGINALNLVVGELPEVQANILHRTVGRIPA